MRGDTLVPRLAPLAEGTAPGTFAESVFVGMTAGLGGVTCGADSPAPVRRVPGSPGVIVTTGVLPIPVAVLTSSSAKAW